MTNAQLRPPGTTTPPFVALVGIDGAGKSTISAKLVAELCAKGFATALLSNRGYSDLSHPFVRDHMMGLRNLIWEDYPGDPQDLFGHRHYLHLLTAWYEAIDNLVVRPTLESGKAVVADGWIYKLLARSALRSEISDSLLGECFSSLTAPDLVIVLDLEPAVACQRKASITRSEAGHHDGLDGDLRESFIRYQGMVREKLLRLPHPGRRVAVVDASKPEDDVVLSCTREVLEIVLGDNRLNRRPIS